MFTQRTIDSNDANCYKSENWKAHVFCVRRFLRKPNVAEASEQFGKSQHNCCNPSTQPMKRF